MLARVFKIRDRKVFLHFHDDFVSAEHPHAPGGSSKGGQFVKKGTGGGTTTKRKITRRAAKGQAEAGFQPAEGGGKPGFTLPGGGKLPKHIAELKIPPAWKNVRYNPDPKGALLVTGEDKKGKRQPIYSDAHHESKAAKKFDRVQRLVGKFDSIMAKNTKCKTSNNPRTRDMASALSLIIDTGMRPGGETDTGADYKSYGATTLEGRHIITDDDGNTIVRFVSGKHKGKELDMKVTDPEIAKDLQQRAKKAGPDQQIFPAANAGGLGKHIQGLAGAGFMTKDFRTLIGTKVAGNEVANMPIPKTPQEYKKYTKAVATRVSETLGNTPAVAMQSYIAPHVFADWKLASGA